MISKREYVFRNKRGCESIPVYYFGAELRLS